MGKRLLPERISGCLVHLVASLANAAKTQSVQMGNSSDTGPSRSSVCGPGNENSVAEQVRRRLPTFQGNDQERDAKACLCSFTLSHIESIRRCPRMRAWDWWQAMREGMGLIWATDAQK